MIITHTIILKINSDSTQAIVVRVIGLW